MTDVSSSRLHPRPFYDQWSRARRPAAHALWAWHSALSTPQPAGGTVGDNGTEAALDAFFEEEQARAEAGEPLRVLREAVWRRAYAACEDYNLDRTLLGHQVRAARVLCGPTRFETREALEQFVGHWAVPHGRLLAGLADVDLAVRLNYADELARGFFYLARLLRLPRDLQDGRLFLPVEPLRQKGVSIEQLRTGALDEDVRALLWKESVRVRDALAQGRPLIAGLSLRHRFALKRFWIGALELLDELERRDFDLWSGPLRLSFVRRCQVYLQTLLGRSLS